MREYFYIFLVNKLYYNTAFMITVFRIPYYFFPIGKLPGDEFGCFMASAGGGNPAFLILLPPAPKRPKNSKDADSPGLSAHIAPSSEASDP